MLGIAANAIVNAPHIEEDASGLFERSANLSIVFSFTLARPPSIPTIVS